MLKKLHNLQTRFVQFADQKKAKNVNYGTNRIFINDNTKQPKT